MTAKLANVDALGVFYLGRSFDVQSSEATSDLVLYDSSDLTTHAVCVGMTGSGKTGLCISLIEEAAIDGIPVIAIDPKGDIANVLLAFDQLSPQQFLPWVSVDEARRQGVTVEALAERESIRWTDGLKESEQGRERVKRFKDSAEFAVYTPGSTAGLPVSILNLFSLPSPSELEEPDLLRDRISAAASSILSLLGLTADPLRSREHILIASIISSLWSQGESLSLEDLVALVQKPPLSRVGAVDLESFFPAKDRQELALLLNNLLASPGFDVWMKGAPLDVDSLLYTADGKPRVSIFSIAHLPETERMFFVTLLLNQTIAWMRRQSGTTSLRAMLYMDEIFGYFPPTANPPSKQPLLTLMKQARAFGLGVVLATQNPVDLDYKGLGNAGTWFIGRLQTERDKARLLDGLESAGSEGQGGFSRAQLDQIISSLSKRIFAMKRAGDDALQVFQTRWTLSYLRGPLARNEIKNLVQSQQARGATAGSGQNQNVRQSQAQGHRIEPPQIDRGGQSEGRQGVAGQVGQYQDRQILPPDIEEFFLHPNTSVPGVTYRPTLMGFSEIHFVDAKTTVDVVERRAFVIPLSVDQSTISWDDGQQTKTWMDELSQNAVKGARYGELPPDASQSSRYKAWTKEFTAWLSRTQKYHLLYCRALNTYSFPNEPDREFRIRLRTLSNEKRDEAAQKLRQKYSARLTALQTRLRSAEDRVDQHKLQARDADITSAINIGATVLGAFVGRRGLNVSTLGRAASAARGQLRSTNSRQKAARAEDAAEEIARQLEELEQEFQDEMNKLALQFNQEPVIEPFSILPRRQNISVLRVALVWAAR